MRTIYVDVTKEGVVNGWSSSRGNEGDVEVQIEPDHPFLNSMPNLWSLVKGVFVMNDDKSLTKAIERKREKLNEDCTASILAGFTHKGDEFQFTEKDQSNFNQQLSLLLLDHTIEDVLWKTENNGIKLFTREQFIETCKAGELHKRNNISHYWSLTHYIESLKSIEEVQAINFDFDFDFNNDTEVKPDTESEVNNPSDTEPTVDPDSEVEVEPEVETEPTVEVEPTVDEEVNVETEVN